MSNFQFQFSLFSLMKTRSVNELNGIIAILNETDTHIHHNHRQVPPME